VHEKLAGLYGLIVEHFGRWVCSHERPARQEAPGVPRQCSRAVDTCGELQAKNSTLQVQTQHTQQFPQTVFSVRESRQATITQQGNNTFVGNFATCGVRRRCHRQYAQYAQCATHDGISATTGAANALLGSTVTIWFVSGRWYAGDDERWRLADIQFTNDIRCGSTRVYHDH